MMGCPWGRGYVGSRTLCTRRPGAPASVCVRVCVYIQAPSLPPPPPSPLAATVVRGGLDRERRWRCAYRRGAAVGVTTAACVAVTSRPPNPYPRGGCRRLWPRTVRRTVVNFSNVPDVCETCHVSVVPLPCRAKSDSK